MDKKAFLTSKEIKDKQQKQRLGIRKNKKLSAEQKTLTNIILEKELYGDNYLIVNEGSQLYTRTQELFTGNKYKKNKKIFGYLFGEQNADGIVSCLDRLPKVMYQTSYGRRSFRAPNNRTLTVQRRIKFIILLNKQLRYEMTIEDYFRYSLGYNNFFWLYVAEQAKRDENLFNQLIDGVYMRHELITINKELIGTLLFTNDIKAFEAVKDLLLSAQRQEGLRQTILECLDETTIEAQTYFMKVILDNNLIRFSSVKRALFTWCGIGYDVERESTVKRFMELGYQYLSNPSEIQSGIKSMDNAECYMALWAKGCTDVEKTFSDLHRLYDKGDTQKKLLALYFARTTNLLKIYKDLGAKAILSDNIKVFLRGMYLIETLMFSGSRNPMLHKYFSKDKIIKMYNNAMMHYKNSPKKKIEIEEKFFDFAKYTVKTSSISIFMYNLSQYDSKLLTGLVDIFEDLDADARATIVMKKLKNIEADSSISDDELKLIFYAVKDRSATVRRYGFKAIKHIELSSEQQIEVEDLLKTKNSAYRKAIINTLMQQDVNVVKQSVERLLSRDSMQYNLGALDILNQLKTDNIENEWVKQKAAYYKDNIKTDDQAEILLKNILGGKNSVLEYSQQNGFGLYDINYEKDYRNIERIDEKALKNIHLSDLEITFVNEHIARLKELISENAVYEYETETYGIKQKVLLGNSIRSRSADWRVLKGEELFKTYPLAEVWREWYEQSGFTPRQLFLTRLYIEFNVNSKYIGAYNQSNSKQLKMIHNLCVYGMKKVDYESNNKIYFKKPLPAVLEALLEVYPYEHSDAIEFYRMQIQNVVASIDKKIFRDLTKPTMYSSVGPGILAEASLRQMSAEYIGLAPHMNKEQLKDCIYIYSYISRTVSGLCKNPGMSSNGYGLNTNIVCKAFDKGAISEDEFIENLLAPNTQKEIAETRYRYRTKYLEVYPFLAEYMDKISNRLLEIETARGEAATNASYITCKLGYVRGAENYAKILKALGKSGLHSGHMWSSINAGDSKKTMMSFLLRQAKPKENEEYNDFKEIIDRYNISRTKLIESAVYNPVWVPLVKEYLGIEYFESAVWWIYAHTNGAQNLENVSEIGKYSKIELADFRNGAVDVDWFKNIYNKIDCWDEIYKCGKYVTEGNGHTRAQLFADAILGKVKIEDAKKKVDATRNKDNLRIIGLIPLGKNKKTELLDRYNYIQKFAKQSKQFGAQRQSSEKIAVQIAVDNLARTGGYLDTMRFVWNMETENTIDILNKSQNVKVGDILVSIIVGEDGRAKLQVQKGEKIQKTIPVKHKNSEQIKEMKAFVKDLNAQGKRVSKSMEEAMVNMDYFEADEIKKLMKNPIIKPVLSKLVIKAGDDLGFYYDGNIVGKKQRAIQKDEKVYIAHCYDLYKSDDWEFFQEKCFIDKIKQPFKQIFRELYVPTEDELQEKSISRRYAGYQVATNKTFALLKSRGWQVNYEEGLLKYFKKQNIIVNMFATANWFTPAEIEAPTLEIIQFLDANKGKRMAFEDIEPTIFSETMRDIDLVVSVAYVGGVDPEASHSTIEMRRALINETAKLFKLDNYRLKDNHAIIEGHYGEYSVHLGSGIVHKIMGPNLSIIPVHSGHRGRLFLPFMDNDPKSAEILSKVLLLCRDKSIKDPTILRQIE